MPKTAMVNVRTNEYLKADVETILRELGISVSEAINIFFSQVKLHKGIPFEVRIPNKKTLDTFKKTDEGKELMKCKDAKDMFKKLGI